jgi:hypothetical protein
MKTISLRTIRNTLLSLLLVGISTFATAGEKILIDFGTSGTYRGADVSNPDSNGNYWNGVGYSGATDMVDISNNVTTIDLAMTTSYGTDYFNGPSGSTQDPAQTVYDAGALGDLGIDEAVYDFFGGSTSDGSYVEKFEIRDLDPLLDYNLTFFGSHKYNNDNTTRYSITDSSGTVLDSVDLLVGVNGLHNQDTTVTIANVAPDANNKIYVQFVGTGGNGGYLNAMVIEDPNSAPVITNLVVTRVSGLPIKILKTDLAIDPDGDPLTFSINTTSNGAALTQDSTYIHVPASILNDQFTFVVDDSLGGTNSGIASVVVGKITPTISTPPMPGDINYGETLASSTLTGGVATNEPSGVAVPGSFAFLTPSLAPDAGVTNVYVVFTPTDAANYNSTTTTVSVTVNGDIDVEPGLLYGEWGLVEFSNPSANAVVDVTSTLDGQGVFVIVDDD